MVYFLQDLLYPGIKLESPTLAGRFSAWESPFCIVVEPYYELLKTEISLIVFLASEDYIKFGLVR